MRVDNYTDKELKQELEESREKLDYYKSQDKRLRSVKREILWYNAIVLRDEKELERRIKK